MSYIVLGGAGEQGRAIVRYLRMHTNEFVYSVDPAGSFVVSDDFIAHQGSLETFFDRPYGPAMKGSVVISCLRPELNDDLVYKCEHKGARGFIDLGGSDTATLKARSRKRPYWLTRVVDCGLAPGVPSMIARKAVQEKKRRVYVWCGGLPANETEWNHVNSFNTEGLVAEYSGSAQIIKKGKVARVPSLYGLDYKEAPTDKAHLWPMQAAFTSGGLSFTPEALAGKLDTLEYRTLRPAGHWDFLKEHILWREKKEAAQVMREIFPRVSKDYPDVIFLGYVTSPDTERIWYRWKYDHEHEISAMAQATGYITASVATLIFEERFPIGLIGMHDIDLEEIIERAQKMPGQFEKVN